ncbi:MAG: heme ABC transporter ATP-binding protein [Rothia sp. (in: high G+C Gram-positive bacteria)]|nr:heme ABC transporter ATP-binding protein [Rothia sp. (in: high G+C Gram-positive bacteria)]
MISAQNLSYSYGTHQVIADVSFSTAPGQITGLVGPNGSGKSTLIRLLSGIMSPNSGTITIDGEPLNHLSAKARSQRIAVVVQERDAEPGLSVAEMVMLGRTPHLGIFQHAGAEDEQEVALALEQVDALKLAHRSFSQLSGGEKQRVLVARALAQKTNYLLLDEPTNHLDVRHQHELMQLIRASQRQVIVVLHDLNLAAQYCDRIAILHQGHIVSQGQPQDVLVPEVLEPVYGVRVHPTDVRGTRQLFFELKP